MTFKQHGLLWNVIFALAFSSGSVSSRSVALHAYPMRLEVVLMIETAVKYDIGVHAGDVKAAICAKIIFLRVKLLCEI